MQRSRSWKKHPASRLMTLAHRDPAPNRNSLSSLAEQRLRDVTNSGDGGKTNV
jgi:hypothetical protein